MMYYLPWVLLVIVSVWAALAGFFWGLSNGQFSDQQRARYLPLRDLGPMPDLNGSRPHRELLVLFSLLGIALFSIGITIYIIFTHTPGGFKD